MGLIDRELQLRHVKEERLLRFKEFVQEQSTRSGMGRACLLSEGHRDFFGEVVFGTGMYNSLWILPVSKNPKVLIFDQRRDAKEYAKTLQRILRENGFPFSRAWAEPVAVRITTEHPYFKSISPTVTYEYESRYIIQMYVK